MTTRARRRTAVLLAVLLGWLAMVAFLITWPRTGSFTLGPPATQFHAALDSARTQEHPGVLGVGHNAGNEVDTARNALEHDADVVEVDVIPVRGSLVAGRELPFAWLTHHVVRGPSLDALWDRTIGAPAMKLDLKRTDEAFLSDVAEFVSHRVFERDVMIASRSPEALEYLRPRLLGVTLLQTVAHPEALDALRSDPQPLGRVNGVSLYEGLADPATMRWLQDEDLFTMVWTVNDVDRLDHLVALGADAITTDNLAILEHLGRARP